MSAVDAQGPIGSVSMNDVAAEIAKSRDEALSVKAEILALARVHGIAYQPTALDDLGNVITRLAGDDVQLDEPGFLLLALRRAGHITSSEAARLHGKYLRAKYE